MGAILSYRLLLSQSVQSVLFLQRLNEESTGHFTRRVSEVRLKVRELLQVNRIESNIDLPLNGHTSK